jgi:hypothetical protein
LHNEELHNLQFTEYYSGDQVQEGEMSGGAFSTNGRDEKCNKIEIGKVEGKIPLGRHRNM